MEPEITHYNDELLDDNFSLTKHFKISSIPSSMSTTAAALWLASSLPDVILPKLPELLWPGRRRHEVGEEHEGEKKKCESEFLPKKRVRES